MSPRKFPFAHNVRSISALVSLTVLAGCSGFAIEGEQSRHYLIIGLGMVSVPKSETVTAIEATKVQALGLMVSNQPGLRVAAGYASGVVVSIPDGASDVRVEVSDFIGGPVTISAPKAVLGAVPNQ